MKFSIVTKLILATLFLVLVVTVPLSIRSAQYFQRVSELKERESNLASASATAVATDNLLQSLIEKSKTLGTLHLLNEKKESPDLVQTFRQLLNSDKDIIAIEIFVRPNGTGIRLEKAYFKDSKEVQLDNEKLALIKQENPFPLTSVANGLIEIMPMLRATAVPMVALGLPLSRSQLGQIESVIVTYFELSRIQRAFARASESRTTFLVDRRGELIAHPDEDRLFKSESFGKHPAYRLAEQSRFPQGEIVYQNQDGVSLQAAFARTTLGPIIVTEVPQEMIFAPSKESQRQAIVLIGLILSIALFGVVLLANKFSSPIEKLASFIKEISKGNLQVEAKKSITTNDEVGLLANAFDEMVDGLRERAKAYAVMNQALGGSVVATIMNMREEELGGQLKQVTVLFSDLRGFTEFSEGHSPEEVVFMLNEYFDVMVKIINKHGGWLDKFIGDAIMAVWGVPYPQPGDDSRALLAALEMRIALNELNAQRQERGLSPIKIGVGLHSGVAIVGKIGATERANLTVIGDTVNQASRIEAATKAFGTDILLSGELAEKVKKDFVLEFAGEAEVKGKAQPLAMFKLRGYINAEGLPMIVKTPYSDYESGEVDKIKKTKTSA